MSHTIRLKRTLAGLLLLLLVPTAGAQSASEMLRQYRLLQRYDEAARRCKEAAQYARSQALYEEGLDSLTAPRYRFELANNFAELLLRRGMYASAQQVLDEFAGLDDPRLTEPRNLRQADICIYRGEFGRADSLYAAATTDDPATRAAIAANRGYIGLETGDYARSLTFFAAARQHYGSTPAGYAILSNRAVALGRCGRTDEALAAIDSCLAYFAPGTPDHTIGLRKKAEILLAAGRKAEAAAAFRQYVDDERAAALRQFPAFSEQQRIDYWHNKKPLLSEAFALEDECPDFLFDVALFRREVALLGGADSARMAQRLRIAGRDVRWAVRPGETAIDFVRYEKNGVPRYGALIVPAATSSRPVVFRPLWTEEELNTFRVQGERPLKAAVCSRSHDDKDLIYTDTALARRIWAPLLEGIAPGSEVYFAPDGLLHLLAIEYLPYGPLEGIGLHRLTSTARLLDRRAPTRSAAQATPRTLVLGGLDYDDPSDTGTPAASAPQAANHDAMDYLLQHIRTGEYVFTPLEGTRVEAETIDTLLHGEAQVSFAMTEEELKAQLRQHRPDRLHLSTHGYSLLVDVPPVPYALRDSLTEDRSLLAAGIALTGANVAHLQADRDDGILSARELCDLRLEGIDLAVLSACQSALGDASDEGPAGLVRGLKKAGVRTVVATLWEVDDQSATQLMAYFYAALSRRPGDGKTAALETARRRLRTSVPAEDGTTAPARQYSAGKLAGTAAHQCHAPMPEASYAAPRHWAAFIIIDDI